jgi:glycosyltransferase involved in cell wall biosynthesis
MKILYFSRSYTPHDFRFLSAIVESGHKVFFLRLKNGKALEKRPLPKGVQQVSGPLKTIIAKIKPDLLHAGPLTDCGYQAARSGFHPLVQMSWGSDILWEARKNKTARSRVRFALAHADALIGDCHAVQTAAAKYRFPKDQIVIFPWGVDLSKFSPNRASDTLRKRHGWQDKFVLLHLRTWEPLYDPVMVVRAFVRATRENTRLRLLMPGNGKWKTKIVSIIQKAGMLDRVLFPGQISQHELPTYFRSSDLYVSAAQSDGSSVSLMEALACGVPALVSDIPGNREWIQTGKQGWLFPAGNEFALAKAILVAERSDRLKAMARQSRRLAEKKANWAKNKHLLFQAYEIALESKG